MDKVFFGVDIGGTATKLGAFSAESKLLDKWEIPTDTGEHGSRIMPNIAAEIVRYAGTTENVIAAGVGVPGPVRRDGYVRRCVNLGWGGFNPARDLSAQLEGVPTFAGNDANMAAMGEYWQGGGQGARSLVFITLGTGVGGGIVLDGRVVYGSTGLGGEIGHVVVNPDEPMPCNCGQYGCLDQTASATGVVRHAKRVLARRTDEPSALRALDAITARDVFDAAKAGDALAYEAVDTCMGFLGKSMAMLTNIIDPDMYIIGGGVSKAGEFLIDLVRRHYEQLATLSEQRAKIALATLGNDAGIYGAAKLAMDAVRR